MIGKIAVDIGVDEDLVSFTEENPDNFWFWGILLKNLENISFWWEKYFFGFFFTGGDLFRESG